MSKQRESFVFYRSFFEAIEEVEPQDQLPIYRAIAMYALDRKEPKLTGFAKVLWRLIKPQIDANWARFENGCKGGAPIGNKNAEKNNQKTTEKQPNVFNVLNVNENENGKNNPDFFRKRCIFQEIRV